MCVHATALYCTVCVREGRKELYRVFSEFLYIFVFAANFSTFVSIVKR